MGRTFGKYRSRRSKEATKKAAAKKPEPEDEESDREQEVTDTESEMTESEDETKGGALDFGIAEMGQDYLKQMQRDTEVAMEGLLPNRLHVDTMDEDLLPKVVSVLDDHQYNGLKHAAKYILGHPTDTVFHHRHRASQPMKHFKKIAESTRDELASHLAGSDKMHRAVHEAMHSAHLGGGFDFSHAIHVAEHLHEPVGGGFLESAKNFATKAESMMGPLSSIKKGVDEYKSIDMNDTSFRGVAKNAMHAYTGNIRMGSAVAQGAAIFAPEAAPELLAASAGATAVADGVHYFNTKIV